MSLGINTKSSEEPLVPSSARHQNADRKADFHYRSGSERYHSYSHDALNPSSGELAVAVVWQIPWTPLPQSVADVGKLIMAVFIMSGNWLVSAWPMHGFAAKVMAFVLPSGTGFVALLISLLSLRVLDPCLFDKVSPYLGRWRSRLMDLAGYPQGLP